MNTLILYVVQSALYLSLFCGLYLLLLRREAFFGFNRSVLIAIMAASMALPMFRVPIAEPTLIQAPMMQLQKIFMLDEQLQTIVLSETATSAIPAIAMPEISAIAPKRLTPFNIISIAYFAGFFVSLMFALVSLFSVARIIATARQVMYGQHRIMVSPRNISSFTFAGWIVISEMDYERFAAEIVAHESIHLRSGHFGDLCFANVLVVIQWFNPFIWLLRRELKSLHEYEADCQTLTQGINATRYKLLLIEKAVGASRYSVANGFAQTKIKNRIDMMNKKNRNLRARWKILLFIPPAALMTLAFARPEISRENLNVNEIDVVIKVDPESQSEGKHALLIKGGSWKEVENVWTKINNQQIAYNGQSVKLSQLFDLLAVDTKKNVGLFYFQMSSKDVEDSERWISIFAKEVDIDNPKFYYSVDGKQVERISLRIDSIQSITVYSPVDAAEQFGMKAKNGAISILTTN